MPQVLRDEPETELLEGREYPKVSPKRTHASVQGAMLALLRRCAAGHGWAGCELRVRLAPGMELVPDVAFISYDRLRGLNACDREEPPFAPDVAVEVRSPSNRAAYDARKIAAYLAHGARLVLDIDPSCRALYAHEPNGGVCVFRCGEVFVHESFAWLQFGIDELFADLDIPD